MKFFHGLFFIFVFLFICNVLCFSLTSRNTSYNRLLPFYSPYQFFGNKIDTYIVSSNTNFEIFTNQVIIIGRGKTNFSIQVVSNAIITVVTNLNPAMVPKPSLSAGRIAGETALSLTGAVLPWGIFFYFYTEKSDPSYRANIAFYTAPALALSLALSSLGTYFIGNVGNETGEYFDGALTGSLCGLFGGVFAGSIGSLIILNSDSIPKDARATYAAIAFASSAAVCETIGSIIMFNKTISYKKTKAPYLNIQPEYTNGRFSLRYNLKFDMAF